MEEIQPGLPKRLAVEGRRLFSQHRQLDTLVDHLIDALEVGRAGAVEHMAVLERALRAHFDMEETTHFPALHGVDPSHRDAIRQLVEEHVGFRDELDAIRASIDAADLDRAGDLLGRLLLRLADHERREELLLPPDD